MRSWTVTSTWSFQFRANPVKRCLEYAFSSRHFFWINIIWSGENHYLVYERNVVLYGFKSLTNSVRAEGILAPIRSGYCAPWVLIRVDLVRSFSSSHILRLWLKYREIMKCAFKNVFGNSLFYFRYWDIFLIDETRHLHRKGQISFTMKMLTDIERKICFRAFAVLIRKFEKRKEVPRLWRSVKGRASNITGSHFCWMLSLCLKRDSHWNYCKK